jgi:hypothetical protein
MVGLPHPGLIALALFGALLYGGVIAVGARCKNTLRRRLMVYPISWLGIMTPILGNKLFLGSTGSTSSFDWPWIAVLGTVFLVISAFSRRI